MKTNKRIASVLALVMVIPFSLGFINFTTDTSEAKVVVDPTILWTYNLGSVAYYAIVADSQGHVHILMHSMEDVFYATNEEGGPSSFNTRHLGFDQGDTLGSIVLDSQDQVHISYKIEPAEREWIPEIHYATDVGGSWYDEVIDWGNVGLGDNSIAVDTQNHVHIVYITYLETNNVLKYATFRGGMWANETIAQNVSSYSISTDTDDHIYICYQNNNGDLRIAYSKDGYSWSTQAIVTGDVGNMWNPITVDSQNIVHMSYLSTNGDLKYVNNRGGSWNVRTIAADVGEYYHYHMVVSNQGHAHIIYWQYGGDLMYTTNSGGSWSTQTIVDNVRIGGAYMALDSQNHAHVNYGDADSINTSGYATNMDGSWIHETVIEKEYDPDEIGGGRLVVDALGVVHYLTGSHTMYYVNFTPTVLSAPGSPTALTAEPGNNQVQLAWAAPTNNGGSAITGYRLYWSLDPNGTFASITVSGTSYLHEGIENGRTYYYKVSAVNAEGESEPSSTISATPTPFTNVPSAPMNPVAQASSNSIMLTWNPPISDGGSAIIRYNVYYSLDPDGIFASIGVNGTSYLHEGLENGRTYYYTISAINANGEGIKTGTISATPSEGLFLPSGPTNLVASVVNGDVSLNWAAPSDDEDITGYKIYRGNSPSNIQLLTSTTDTTFLDTTVANNRTYYYHVSAFNEYGESNRSNTVIVVMSSSNEIEPSPSFYETIEGQIAIAGMVVAGVGAVAYAVWRFWRQ